MSTDSQQQIRIEAARWLAFLHSGEADEARHAAFLDWQARSPQHAECIARINQQLGFIQASKLRDLNPRQLQHALDAPSSRRRFLRTSLGLAGLAVTTGLLSRLGSTGLAWPGDLYTGIGERSQFQLPDGSQLTLDAASRISPHFDGAERGLTLHAGQLLLDVRQHSQRAFVLQAGNLRVEARQQRLLLRQEASACYVAALDADLSLHGASASRTLPHGHWARLSRDGAWHTGPAPDSETLWLKGLFEADALPLEQVVAALRPYHPGLLHLSPAVAGLRVSGLFPLDNSHQALDMLASIAPIRVTWRSRLWANIEPA